MTKAMRNQKKLGKYHSQACERTVLTQKNESPFTLCSREALENGYGFKNLKESNLREIHRFLDKASGLNISQTEKLYLHPTDRNDRKIVGDAVRSLVHYGITRRFHIHGYYEDGLFYVVRLDPNHQFHSS